MLASLLLLLKTHSLPLSATFCAWGDQTMWTPSHGLPCPLNASWAQPMEGSGGTSEGEEKEVSECLLPIPAAECSLTVVVFST